MVGRVDNRRVSSCSGWTTVISDDSGRPIKIREDFDDWVTIVTSAQACVVQGEKPQRLLWPVAGHFECADYFRPTERLPSAQISALIEYFELERPEIDRGRYGFANFLKAKGPPFITSMPRGYIVELVQLLLNKNILLFRLL